MTERKPRDVSPQTPNMVITCMDRRFHRAAREILLRDYGVEVDDSSRLTFTGSSKAVADGTLVPEIDKSHTLHGISNVYVVDHIDCGGFGGLKKFGGNESKEQEAHFESMYRAQDAVHKILPQLVVTTLLVNFDGEKVLPPVRSAD